MASSTNGIDYSVFMDSATVVERLTAGAMGLDSYINSALVTTSHMVREEMKGRAPIGVAGTAGMGLANTISTSVDSVTKTATIKPTAPYAAAVETGSKPHWPPTHKYSALEQWCEMKGLNVWAVAKSISIKGTKAHPYVEPTVEASNDPVFRVFSMGIKQYVEGL